MVAALGMSLGAVQGGAANALVVPFSGPTLEQPADPDKLSVLPAIPADVAFAAAGDPVQPFAYLSSDPLDPAMGDPTGFATYAYGTDTAIGADVTAFAGFSFDPELPEIFPSATLDGFGGSDSGSLTEGVEVGAGLLVLLLAGTSGDPVHSDGIHPAPAVPEPSAIVGLACGSLALLARKRVKRR